MRRASGASDADPVVLKRCQSGDVSALGDLYEVYGALVFAICRRMVGNDADAEDLTQQVFLRVFEQAATFDGRSRFRTWLTRLTVNHTLNFRKAVRRRRIEPLADGSGQEDEAATDPADLAAQRERVEALDGLLARLGAEHRAVIVLRELGELTYAEMAEALQIPVGTVMSRLARARAALKALVTEEKGAPDGIDPGS